MHRIMKARIFKWQTIRGTENRKTGKRCYSKKNEETENYEGTRDGMRRERDSKEDASKRVRRGGKKLKERREGKKCRF
jgi:hypothetical protein